MHRVDDADAPSQVHDISSAPACRRQSPRNLQGKFHTELRERDRDVHYGRRSWREPYELRLILSFFNAGSVSTCGLNVRAFQSAAFLAVVPSLSPHRCRQCTPVLCSERGPMRCHTQFFAGAPRGSRDRPSPNMRLARPTVLRKKAKRVHTLSFRGASDRHRTSHGDISCGAALDLDLGAREASDTHLIRGSDQQQCLNLNAFCRSPCGHLPAEVVKREGCIQDISSGVLPGSVGKHIRILRLVFWTNCVE
ncbi:uncharacterized protein SCHCODRAFT_02045390 [Schizophyllum commune H4-8]|uniref:uncharacterized protein n=1 Tax=Schizophyllum commune (strain H4-8 / FGSC 9210) TaxID=578458 RepID=UPI00215F485D|nr:uncharacterized protein SCHCODRAFT_02045390 [Schizophyllum commune H4-8]KAI5900865.1 hypothetical protein SCHCODRAFT_02045390 [Schizophyllum commune H4-8]